MATPRMKSFLAFIHERRTWCWTDVNTVF